MKDNDYIEFSPSGRRVKVEKDEPKSVLEFALVNKVEIPTSCGGNGSCGACRVIVEKGQDRLPPRNEIEEEFAQDRGFAENERLSCQIHPLQGLKIHVPEST